MPDKTRMTIEGYVTMDALVEAVCVMAHRMRPGECSLFYAVSLEQAAREIREKCKESEGMVIKNPLANAPSSSIPTGMIFKTVTE